MLASTFEAGQPSRFRLCQAPPGILLISNLPLCHRSLLLGVATISCPLEEVTRASLMGHRAPQLAHTLADLRATVVWYRTNSDQKRQGRIMSSHRDTASFGKRQEFIAIARLIKEDFDVYQTLVDDQQIDCVVRKVEGGKPVYMDIQIKARSRKAQEKSWCSWPSVRFKESRPNFFFIFYSAPLDIYWVVPSLYLAKKAPAVKSGKHKGEYKVTFGTFSKRLEKKLSAKDFKAHPERAYLFKPEYEDYREKFELLRKFKG